MRRVRKRDCCSCFLRGSVAALLTPFFTPLPPFPSLRKISPFFTPSLSYLPKNQIGCNYTVVKVAGQKKTSFPSPCLWVAVATISPSPILIFVPFAVAGFFPPPLKNPFSVPPLYLIGATFLHPQRRKRDSTVVKGKKLIFRSLSLSVFSFVSPPLFSLFCR